VEVSQPKVQDLIERRGYNPNFLGDGELLVPLPKVPEWLRGHIALVWEGGGRSRDTLHYTNYSVVMNAERRMAFFSATNIDGENVRRVKRTSDRWYFDPRIDRAAQIGEALYQNNDFDRGHLTRRLDPAWGDDFEQGEKDTFFFTNCAPQHQLFNTKVWLGLEDYILASAEAEGFKVSVFTGPVFSEDDRTFSFVDHKEDSTVQIPLQYWKVAAMVNPKSKKLTVTGYLISQKDLITDLEFVLGQFRTYQVPVSMIEKRTTLDFGPLRDFDPLGRFEAQVVRELKTPSEIVFTH
jgi:endonuclease G